MKLIDAILTMDHRAFRNFTNQQRKLRKTPGNPAGIVVTAEDMEWLEAWEEFQKSIRYSPSQLGAARHGHYRGYMACLKQFKF